MGWEWAPTRSNDGSLALVSCLFGGYKFASVLRCVGLVLYVHVFQYYKNLWWDFGSGWTKIERFMSTFSPGRFTWSDLPPAPLYGSN